MASFGEPQRVPDFPTTHWSRVVQSVGGSSSESRVALEGPCAAYWYPLYAFIRRRGDDAAHAADLVQGLFTHLLDHNTHLRTRSVCCASSSAKIQVWMGPTLTSQEPSI
jgi:hypothetical protein